MNIKLLKQIKRKILAEPKQFYMHAFYSQLNGTREVPNCGTAACIAGWAVALSEHITPKQAKKNYLIPIFKADSLLEISNEQSLKLFYINNWPKDLGEAYHENDNYPTIQAICAAERIDRFIASNGKE